MREKSGTRGSSYERIVRDIRRAIRKQYSAEEKIRIVLDGLAVSPALPSCADARVSPRAFITAGPRSFWRPASAGWRATRRVRRPAARSRTFAGRRGS